MTGRQASRRPTESTGGSRGGSLTEQVPEGNLTGEGHGLEGPRDRCVLDEGSPYLKRARWVREDGYWEMKLRDHPVAQVGGKVRVNRAVAYDAKPDNPVVCDLCKRADLDWSAKRPDPAFVAVDHEDHDRSNNRSGNLRRTHDWCNNNRPIVDQYGIPWSTFTDIPISDRPALRISSGPRKGAATPAALDLVSAPAATTLTVPDPPAGPPPDAGAVGGSPWDDVFVVPASLLETYPFLKEVRP